MVRYLSGILVFIASCCTVKAQSRIVFAKATYADMIHAARQQHKPVLIYFTGTGCLPCLKMEKNVFTNPAVASFYNSSFVNIELFEDAGKPDTAIVAMRKKYDVASNPSFVFIDENGTVIHRSGYKDVPGFLEVGKQAIGDDNYRAWSAQLQAGAISATLLDKYLALEQPAQVYASSGYACKAQEMQDRYFAAFTPDAFLADSNWIIIEKYVANPYSRVFGHLLANQDLYAAKFGDRRVTEKIYSVLRKAWSGNRASGYYKKAEEFIRNSSNPTAKLVERFRKITEDRSEVIEGKHDWNWFIAQYSTDLERYYYLDVPVQVFSACEAICSEKKASTVLLQTANRWMAKAIELDPADPDLYSMYARTFFRLGEIKQAVDNQAKALAFTGESVLDEDEIATMKADLALYRSKLK